MKIAKATGGGDFYESFSDLIFGTLIIFLVVVLSLIIQVQKTVQGMSIDVVSPNRFTGSTGDPMFTFFLLPGDSYGLDPEETVVVFLPLEVAAKVKLTPQAYTTDVELDVTELYRDDKLLWMTTDQFVQMAGGLTPQATLPNYETCPALGLNNEGFFVYAYYQLTKIDPQRAKQLNIGMMRDFMWGTDWYSDALSAQDQRDLDWLRTMDFGQTYNYYDEWLGGLNDGRVPRKMIDPFNNASNSMLDPPTGFRITIPQGTEKKVMVGQTSFEPDAFRMLLQAIAPGKDFVVECVDDAGKPLPPPRWVEDELLFPAGYDARVLKQAELQAGDD
ncbi:MAG: hypothetical protein AAGC44_04060 [Planctomycetota bacterium]